MLGIFYDNPCVSVNSEPNPCLTIQGTQITNLLTELARKGANVIS